MMDLVWNFFRYSKRMYFRLACEQASCLENRIPARLKACSQANLRPNFTTAEGPTNDFWRGGGGDGEWVIKKNFCRLISREKILPMKYLAQKKFLDWIKNL